MKIKNKFLRKILKILFFIPVLLWVTIGCVLYYLGDCTHNAGVWMTKGKLNY